MLPAPGRAPAAPAPTGGLLPVRFPYTPAARAGVAVTLVAHDLAIAARYADRVALVSEGLVASVGKPAEVLTSRAVSGAFDVEATVSFEPRGEASIRVESPPVPALRWLERR